MKLNYNIWQFAARCNSAKLLPFGVINNCGFASCSSFPKLQPTLVSIQNRKFSISPFKKALPEKDEDGLPIDYKTSKFTITSKRLDQFLAKVLGVTRTSLEKIIVQGSVRVNEEIIIKRAQEIDEDDDIEVYTQPLEGNDKLAIVQRVLVIERHFDEESGYHYKTRFWREYITDNWKQGLGELKEEEEENA
ncbi:hypothetical protein ACQ4LE_008876 [Meloidogyne hapla]|uniref:S4 RNA-binding domain-containing protein n=1 Tax=Meloidogyne hapla TaxID=6305 RepID=A0A1I8B9W6_MELHA